METVKPPTKEQVREYLVERTLSHLPPPDQKEIRRILGQDLVDQERKGRAR